MIRENGRKGDALHCGETFDIRDSCQVLVHYHHQAAGAACR
jgi:hypothetical protein